MLIMIDVVSFLLGSATAVLLGALLLPIALLIKAEKVATKSVDIGSKSVDADNHEDPYLYRRHRELLVETEQAVGH